MAEDEPSTDTPHDRKAPHLGETVEFENGRGCVITPFCVGRVSGQRMARRLADGKTDLRQARSASISGRIPMICITRFRL
jgi:hypothetical protein